jgi:hypothetical protein
MTPIVQRAEAPQPITGVLCTRYSRQTGQKRRSTKKERFIRSKDNKKQRKYPKHEMYGKKAEQCKARTMKRISQTGLTQKGNRQGRNKNRNFIR